MNPVDCLLIAIYGWITFLVQIALQRVGVHRWHILVSIRCVGKDEIGEMELQPISRIATRHQLASASASERGRYQWAIPG